MSSWRNGRPPKSGTGFRTNRLGWGWNYSRLGFILKKVHPRYNPRRYGCKTLGAIYEKLNGYEVAQTEESGTVIRRKQDNP
jgi:hypothetical protein